MLCFRSVGSIEEICSFQINAGSMTDASLPKGMTHGLSRAKNGVKSVPCFFKGGLGRMSKVLIP